MNFYKIILIALVPPLHHPHPFLYHLLSSTSSTFTSSYPRPFPLNLLHNRHRSPAIVPYTHHQRWLLLHASSSLPSPPPSPLHLLHPNPFLSPTSSSPPPHYHRYRDTMVVSYLTSSSLSLAFLLFFPFLPPHFHLI